MVMAGNAYAYSDALDSNNSAQITITITPSADREVTITTDNVNMDLGTIVLTGSFVSTQTVKPATVTVNGTIANTDLLLTASIVGGWSFDSSSDDYTTDQIACWMTLSDTDVNDAPSQSASYFDGTGVGDGNDLVGTTSSRIGADGAAFSGRHEDGITETDNMPATETMRHMWFFFRMPDATSSTGDQDMTFVLTVGAIN